jgi:hypothetical protein
LAGVVAVIDVDDTTVTAVADTPPTVTVAPATNPVPIMLITVPPDMVPAFGDTAVTVGAAELYGTALTSFDRAPTTPFFTAAIL